MSDRPLEPSEAVAAAALFTDHQPWLLGRLHQRLRNRAEAEDVTSETLLRVLGYRRLHLLQEPRAYLTTVAKSVLAQLWRRRDIERAWVEAETAARLAHPTLAASPEDRALLLEALQRIADALDSLSPKARTAFLMSQLDGCTYAEIAEALGVSASMVRKYMAQALALCVVATEGPGA